MPLQCEWSGGTMVSAWGLSDLGSNFVEGSLFFLCMWQSQLLYRDVALVKTPINSTPPFHVSITLTLPHFLSFVSLQHLLVRHSVRCSSSRLLPPYRLQTTLSPELPVPYYFVSTITQHALVPCRFSGIILSAPSSLLTFQVENYCTLKRPTILQI